MPCRLPVSVDPLAELINILCSRIISDSTEGADTDTTVQGQSVAKAQRLASASVMAAASRRWNHGRGPCHGSATVEERHCRHRH